MVFGYGLGWDLRSFLYRRSTSASALKALFQYYCREYSPVTPPEKKPQGYTQQALKRLSKINQISAIITAKPCIAVEIRELTIAVPSDLFVLKRDDRDGEDKLVQQRLCEWRCEAISSLLRRLTSLVTLTLVGLWVSPWFGFAIHDFEIPGSAILIPPSVKHLVIKEIYTTRASDDAIPMMRRTHPSYLDTSTVLGQFCGYNEVEHLHLELPLPDATFFNGLPYSSGIKSLRLDFDCIDPFSTRHGQLLMSELLRTLNGLPNLTTLELRYSANKFRQTIILPKYWHRVVPRIPVVRLPVHAFADAF